MDAFLAFLLGAVIALFTGYCMGYAISAGTIGIECQRLGSFYVGDKTYECKAKP